MPRHRPPVLARTLAAAGLALLAGACSDQPFDASLGRSPAGAALSTANPAEPPLIANAVKYAERGAKPATGRSGSASLTARALMGKDGQTLLEVTTGALDTPAPAPGTLAKLQVKQFTPKDEALRTLNYNNLPGGGYAAYSYGGLVRGAKLQVQANVRGIDPRRTDVVTVTETVHLRPDLRVQLNAPAKARRGIPVNVAAVVSEGNGDVGARANCVLYVDGVEADRANGIWVDAGDPVSCAFTHVFETSGSRHLRVAVTDVVPGDFEPANNSAEGSIEISEEFKYHYASVQDGVSTTHYNTVSRWSRGDWQGESSQETNYVSTFQSAYLFAMLPVQVSFPLASIEMSLSTNGAPVHSAKFTGLSGDEEGRGSLYHPCVSRRMSGGTVISVCTYDFPGGFGSLNYQRYAGVTTYQGYQYSRQWYPGGPEYVYFSNYSGEYSRHGDDPFTFSIDQTVVMGPVQHRSYPIYLPDGRFCWNDSFSDGSVSEGCTLGEQLISERQAFSVGGNPY
jgi:hypothetical protein